MAMLARVAPEVPVSDLQAALAFYTQKLGFRVAAELPAGDYAIVERDDVAIHLFSVGDGQLSPVGLHVFTHDLEELQQELLSRGVRLSQAITRRPWGNRDFRVHDEWGNQIKFTEPSSDE